MREYLRRLPKEILELIYKAQDIACRNNMAAYLVGGFVRDLLLGVKNLDLDIVLEGNGIKFAEDFASLLKAKLIRHKRFGTATLIIKPHHKIDPLVSLRGNGERPSASLRTALSERSESNGRSRTIDIASARKEYYPAPAHLPVVELGSLQDDLFRRDFTINAMALSLGCSDFGKLIDLFGGKSDLQDKKIRVLHPLSFIDDPTRIFRAVRFEQRLDFKIEVTSLKRLKEAVLRKMLHKLEPQRMRDDLILILKEQRPLKYIKRLQKLAGFKFLKPNLSLSSKTYSLLSSIEKEIEWFKKNFPQRRHLDAWLVYFIGIIDSLSLKDVKSICDKLVFRKGEEKRLLTHKKISSSFIAGLNKNKLRASRIFASLEPLSYEVIMALKAKYRMPAFQRNIEEFFRFYNGMRICISGEDLQKLGLIPGPHYQKIFAKLLNAKLDGLIKTKKEEEDLVKRFAKK